MDKFDDIILIANHVQVCQVNEQHISQSCGLAASHSVSFRLSLHLSPYRCLNSGPWRSFGRHIPPLKSYCSHRSQSWAFMPALFFKDREHRSCENNLCVRVYEQVFRRIVVEKYSTESPKETVAHVMRLFHTVVWLLETIHRAWLTNIGWLIIWLCILQSCGMWFTEIGELDLQGQHNFR